MPILSGYVRDDTDALVGGRIVRAYNRATGELAGQVVSGDGVTGDPNYPSVSLLMDFDAGFLDSGPAARPITVLNGAPAISTTVKRNGAAAGDFRRLGSVLAPSGMDFGTGDLTVECWIYWNTASGSQQWGAFQLSTPSGYSATNQNIAVFANTGSTYAFYFGSFLSTSAAITTGVWSHLAICRAGTTVRFFVNGVQIHSITSSFNFTGAAGVIGGYYNSSYDGDLLLDDFRVTKGVALYTSNFTPPAAAHPPFQSSPLGYYSLTVPTSDPHYLVFLDDDAGAQYNALIRDRVTPI